MNDYLEIFELLKQKTTKFVYPLVLEGVVLNDEFDDLLSFVEDLSQMFKYDSMLPKNILKELLLTLKSIKSQNERLKSKELSFMEERLEHVFNLILGGESVDDRKPGVPRII